MRLRNRVAVMCLALAPITAQANLIVNGGFEDPVISDFDWDVFGAISGWSGTGSGIEIQRNVAGSPFEGQQHVELDSFSNSGMSQSVATTAGASYLLSFAYSPRAGYGSATNEIELWLDDVLRDSFTGNGIGAQDTNWAVLSYSVIGDGSTKIEFRAAGTSDSLGGYLDDVRLTVPEPGTLALSGLTLAALALLRRRKRA
jgi:hypothetical protein